MFPRVFHSWFPCRSLKIVSLWLLVEHSVFFFSVCADCRGPGAGWAGEEAEVGLQGGAAHRGHVSGELRVNLPPLQDLTYLSLWQLQPQTRYGTSVSTAGEKLWTSLVWTSPSPFMMGPSDGQLDVIKGHRQRKQPYNFCLFLGVYVSFFFLLKDIL